MKRILILAAGICCLPLASVHAQLFSSDLDDGAGWGVQADADTSYSFGFDYSRFGIPSAPNGSGTTGLAMMANLTAEQPDAGATVSVYPEGQSLSGQYRVAVDMWLNFNTSGGTTEAGGMSVGFAPGSTVNGASFLGNTDGDSGSDYQLFADGVELDLDSGAYAISSKDHANAADLMAQFPGQTTPAAQGEAPFDPTNVIVTAADGTLGFAWHRLIADVDSDAGTAKFSIGDFEIGTVSGADLSGGLALTFRDPFGSVASKPEFAFGVFDNVSVTQVPEPASMVLAMIGVLGLGVFRRRR